MNTLSWQTKLVGDAYSVEAIANELRLDVIGLPEFEVYGAGNTRELEILIYVDVADDVDPLDVIAGEADPFGKGYGRARAKRYEERTILRDIESSIQEAISEVNRNARLSDPIIYIDDFRLTHSGWVMQ
jgi:hypothetical protein